MFSRAPRPLLGLGLGGALLAGVALTAMPAAASDTGADTLHRFARPAAATQPGPARPADRLAAVETAAETAAVEATGLQAAAAAAGHPGAVPGGLAEPAADLSAAGAAPAGAADDPTEPTPEPTPTTSEPTPSPSEPSPDPTPTPTTPPVDTTAPTGAFSLSATALWIGQKVTLTQTALADDTSGPSLITRVVDWGDGSATTLEPGATRVTKAYARAGRYTVSVTLTDAAGNTGKATPAKPVMTITVPGAFTLSKKAVWHHEPFKVTFSKVPGGTSRIVLDWADGWLQPLKGKNQTVGGYLHYKKTPNVLLKPGTYTLRATFTNANGLSAPIVVGKITLRKDSWKPTVKISKPAKSKASKVSSWKTIRGTAGDKGSGAPDAFLLVTRYNGSTEYCYTPTKKWKRVYTTDDYNACGLIRKVTKGKWSVKVSGLKKGTIWVGVATIDWAGNTSKVAHVEQRLTRN